MRWIRIIKKVLNSNIFSAKNELDHQEIVVTWEGLLYNYKIESDDIIKEMSKYKYFCHESVDTCLEK
ncbi:CAT RNA binding domain-containing protein [Salipaludibacillus neizhouensis]|uniref:CAT RNA binding domain-containing protein n=1 Tax=Salipaludibacillus neizhouensis TaxID=885475 RepID=UPI001601ED3A